MSTSHAESVEGSGLREWMFPEEDRAMYTTAPWTGGFRWFRARNVVCLEQWRKIAGEPGNAGTTGTGRCCLNTTP